MSARKETGMCLACGAEAKFRCSSCATKSGLDLFFCSKEHQKLIWPFHRLVCGERAHPFALPPYSSEEADLLLKRVKGPPITPQFAELRKAMFKCLRIASNDLPRFEALLQSTIGQGGLILPSKLSLTPAASVDNLVVHLRHVNYDWTMEEVADWTRAMDDPIAYFSFMYSTCTEEAPPVVSDRWTSTFCHHLGATIPPSSELMKLVRQAAGKGPDKRDTRLIRTSEVRQLPGGEEAHEALESAFAAVTSFSMTAPTPAHQAFAQAVWAEWRPANDPETAILAEKQYDDSPPTCLLCLFPFTCPHGNLLL